MNIGERVNRFDAWLLDKVFQPFADRLPERLPAIELGMSLQLGAIMLSAASIVAMIVIGHMSWTDAVFNILVWALGLAFFMGINRVRPMVRTGSMNPLRIMLAGMRPLSIPFAIYALWQGVTAPPHYEIAMWFNSLANIIFVVGIYLISCEPRPPALRQSSKVINLAEARGEA